MSNLYQLEREVSSSEAKQTIVRQINQLHLSFDYLVDDRQKEVTHLELYNEQGQCLSCGSGKGVNCEVGALAEAIEHYSLEKYDTQINKRVLFSKVKNQNQFKKDHLFHSIAEDALVEVTPFIDYHSQNIVDVPVSYINPFYTKEESSVDQVLSRYSSNLGTSFGISKNESYLHALNEAIERHYTSKLYMEFIGMNTGVVWNEYRYTEKHHRAKSQLIRSNHGVVYTLVTKTVFNNFVAVTVLQNSKSKKMPMAQVGAGASVSADLAITRSLDEVLQCVELYGEEEYFEDRYAADQLKEYSRLTPLIYLQKLTDKNIFTVPQTKILNVKDQVALLDNSLRSKGYTPLQRNLMHMGELHVLQVLIPGMERFHLVRTGNLVAPFGNEEK